MTLPSFDDKSLSGKPQNSQVTTNLDISSSWHIPPIDASDPQIIFHSKKAETCYRSNSHSSFLPQSSNVAASSTALMAQTLAAAHFSMHDIYSSEGYSSDPGHADVSHYTTPSFEEQVLNEYLEPALNPQESLQYGFQDISATRQSLEQYHPGQPSASFLPTSASSSVTAGFQLLSPNLTNTSSPAALDMGHASSFTSNEQPAGGAMDMQSLSPSLELSVQTHTPVTNQSHSPFLASSPNEGTTAAHSTLPAHLRSPIVRVENFSREELPSTVPLSRSVSKRSHTSRRSAMHLSPYPADDSSVDESDRDTHRVEQSSPRLVAVLHSPERHDDGSWLVSDDAGPAGLDPQAREFMQNLSVPTLDEQEKERQVAEKNAEVREWLVHSEAGSEAGNAGNAASEIRMRRNAGRRRARSTNDAGAREGLALNPSLILQTSVFEDAIIPGPGAYVDEESGDDGDYSSTQGIDASQSPPADVRILTVAEEALDSSTPPHNTQGSAFPGQVDLSYGWKESSRMFGPSTQPQHPPTANAAIMRFRQRAKEIDSASLTATIGSRRRSESDMGSLFAAPGISKRFAANDKSQERARGLEDQDVTEKGSERRGSFLDNLSFRRSSTNNILRRKKSDAAQRQSQVPTEAAEGSTQSTLQPRKRKGSSSRPKSPRLDTDVKFGSKDSASFSAINVSMPAKALAQARNTLRRARSRSDIGKSPGLKELMSQHGGPPTLTLASPSNDIGSTEAKQALSGGDDSEENGEDDLSARETVTMDLAVRSDPIIPGYEGFKTQVRRLNPRLADYMVERVTQEQIRRYKRLLEARVKHLNCVKNGRCSSGSFCTALVGEWKELPPPVDGKAPSVAPFLGLSSGIPQPPVPRLPAQFECPLCFEAKKAFKPSDWTKHVQEDAQPYTCTFPNCAEPMSFKRKADWVRHENELHRHLEGWTCTMPDCGHTCYRKDNFVQHLVREHKVPEPIPRTGRSAKLVYRGATVELEDLIRWQAADNVAGSTPQEVSEKVWTFVEQCRYDTTKRPEDEPCRFCGNRCTNWRKLQSHLAKHMEQISLPVLRLVEQKHLQADSVISPVEPQQRHHLQTTPPVSAGLANNPTHSNRSVLKHDLETSVEPFGSGLRSSCSQYPTAATAAAQVGQTYPPPQFARYRTQYPQSSSGYSSLHSTTGNFAGSSYPPVSNVPMSIGNIQGAIHRPGQPQQNGYLMTASNRFVPSITPVSAYEQQQMYASPTDATPFFGDSITTAQFSQAGHPSLTLGADGAAAHNGLSYDHSEGLPYSGNQYQGTPSFMHQQQMYSFHSQ